MRAARAAGALAIGAVLLAEPGWLERGSLYGPLADAAGAQLDRSLDRNLLTFGSVSAVKSGMALVEGSSVGVGFDLQVGDLIQPAYDAVDFVWRLLLYALTVLGFYKLLIDSGMPGIGFLVAGVGLLLLGAAVALPWRLPPLGRLGRRLLLVGLVVVYTLPAALLATHWLSDRYLGALSAQHAARMSRAAGELRGHADEMLALREKISLLSPSESLDAVREASLAIARSASVTVQESLRSFLQYVLILAIELLLLPLASAWLLVRLLALALGGLTQVLAPGAAGPAAGPEAEVAR